jgi:hypothetical protein
MKKVYLLLEVEMKPRTDMQNLQISFKGNHLFNKAKVIDSTPETSSNTPYIAF